VRVSKERSCGRFPAVKYALAAFRYLATGFVALVLALLLVLLLIEVAAAVGAGLEHAHEAYPLPAISEDRLPAPAQGKRFLWRAGVEVSLVPPRADFGLATLYSGATTRAAQPSASIVVRF
jgi:hypothetical protein